MHTIKGNARTYQLTYLTDIVHATESTYDRLRKDSLLKDSSAEWSQTQLLDELGLVRSALDRYIAVLKEKLSFASDSFASPQGAILIDKEEYRSLLRKIEPLVSSASQASPMLRLLESLQQLDARPLTGVLGGLVKTLPEVARQLGKPEPKILIQGEDVRVFSDYANTVTNVFSHVLKNSIDHGLEKAEQRVSNGKPEAGVIHIHASQKPGGVEIDVWDDGRGLALKRLHEKMIEEGLLESGSKNITPQRVAESIFMSGLSTAEAITDVSGRGVGMDAVKKYLNACGCDIKIVLAEQASLERDYVPFKLVISLSPNVCFIPGMEKENGAMSCHNKMQKVS
jgi:two-component system chemotaxis sensor kinase CheA